MSLRVLRLANWLLVLAVSIITTQAKAQDTLITYEVTSGNVTYSPLPAYDPTIPRDSTPAFMGIYGVTQMPDTLSSDTFSYISVTRPFNASSYYSTFNFPFTAVINIRYGMNITAALIGPRALLVCTYDVCGWNCGAWRGLSSIKPFFENGSIEYGYNPLTPLRYYTITPYDGAWDYAVIEVAENIGDYSGYFGLAFDTSSQTYSYGHMLYNISYPRDFSSMIYPDTVNGDTMYMRYGYAEPIGDTRFFDFGSGANGEYVSPFFHKDFRIFGQRWSAGDNTKMTPRYFYFLKHMLNTIPLSTTDLKDNNVAMVYPNPASTQLTCLLSQLTEPTSLRIESVDGKIVHSIHSIEKEITQIDISMLPAGLYFLIIQNGQQRAVKKFVKE